MNHVQLLSGVRIVEFTDFLIGPDAAQYLADMGADVIAVERFPRLPHGRTWSGGDLFLNEISVFHLATHRNIRSVALDLKHSAGYEAAMRLCATADVVISNFRPRVREKLGIDGQTLRRRFPDLIYASASGYGATGDSVSLPGQDLLIQALSGLVAVTGKEDSPVAAGVAVVDQHSAALLALGVLGALYRKATKGEGEEVEVTMLQAALDLQSEAYAYHLNGLEMRRPGGPLASTYHQAPYGIYKVVDGHVAISLSPMTAVSEALGDPVELAGFVNREIAFSEREAVAAAVQSAVGALTVVDVVDRLRSRGVWCAPVQDYEAALASPEVEKLSAVSTFEHPVAGTVRVIAHPIRYASGSTGVRRVPPALGQDNNEILAALGYSAEEIEALEADGITPKCSTQGATK